MDNKPLVAEQAPRGGRATASIGYVDPENSASRSGNVGTMLIYAEGAILALTATMSGDLSR